MRAWWQLSRIGLCAAGLHGIRRTHRLEGLNCHSVLGPHRSTHSPRSPPSPPVLLQATRLNTAPGNDHRCCTRQSLSHPRRLNRYFCKHYRYNRQPALRLESPPSNRAATDSCSDSWEVSWLLSTISSPHCLTFDYRDLIASRTFGSYCLCGNKGNTNLESDACREILHIPSPACSLTLGLILSERPSC